MQIVFFLSKVVEGLVPAINSEGYLKPQKPKRRIKPRTYENFKSVNLVEEHSLNHDMGYEIEQCQSEQLKNSFFIKTQGLRRLLESGTAIEHLRCSPSANGTRGGRGREGVDLPPLVRGFGGTPTRKFCNSR